MRAHVKIIALISLLLIGIAFAGAGELLGGETGVTATSVELSLPKETKDKLTNLSTATETVCEEYPAIVCGKWEDDKNLVCLEWVIPKECLEFDAKLGQCLKWDYEPPCTTIVTPIGIDFNKTVIKKTRETDTQTCWSIINTPLINIAEQCLDKEKDVTEYYKERLEKIASEQSDTEKDTFIPEEITVVIK